MSNRLGPLPNFLILGAMKAGTTSLFSYLCQHPDVCGCREKEPNFLASAHRGKGVTSSAIGSSATNWRKPRDLSAYQRLFAHWRGERAIGEASHTSLDSPYAPALAAALLPSARLVAVVRQPADRAFSHYQQNRRSGREPLDFWAALAAETARSARASDAKPPLLLTSTDDDEAQAAASPGGDRALSAECGAALWLADSGLDSRRSRSSTRPNRRTAGRDTQSLSATSTGARGRWP